MSKEKKEDWKEEYKMFLRERPPEEILEYLTALKRDQILKILFSKVINKKTFEFFEFYNEHVGNSWTWITDKVFMHVQHKIINDIQKLLNSGRSL